MQLQDGAKLWKLSRMSVEKLRVYYICIIFCMYIYCLRKRKKKWWWKKNRNKRKREKEKKKNKYERKYV